MKPIRSFLVSIAGHPSEYDAVVVAHSAGAAKYSRFLDVADCAPDLRIIDMRARVIDHYEEPRGFRDCVDSRAIPWARIGMRVRLDDGDDGVIVGHNASANLNVLFEGGRFGGKVLNCHPAWQISYLVNGNWRRSPQSEGQAVPAHWEAL